MTSKRDEAYKSGNQSTSVTTNTTTNIRDVGLTGDAAVALATALEQGGVLREEIAAETIKATAQSSGQSFQQLIGGAGKLIDAQNKTASDDNLKFVLVTGGFIALALLVATRRRA